MRKNKYTPGEYIKTVQDLLRELEDNKYVYYRSRPLYPSFILHMNFETISGGIKFKLFRYAIETKKEA